MKIKLKKLHEDAVLPNYAHPGDVGLDMYSLEDYELQPGEAKIFMTGFAMEFPEGYGAFVMDKSSTGKAKIKTLGGVFDAGYRGEYNVNIINLGNEPFSILKGQKIAQLVILPVELPELEEVEELSDSSRGGGAFGSTGTHWC